MTPEQSEFELVEMRLREVTEDRNRIIAGLNHGLSSAIYVDGWGDRPPMYLPTGSSVRFILEGGEELSVDFNYGQNGYDFTEIQVRTNWKEMSVSPKAANMVSISPRRRS